MFEKNENKQKEAGVCQLFSKTVHWYKTVKRIKRGAAVNAAANQIVISVQRFLQQKSILYLTY